VTFFEDWWCCEAVMGGKRLKDMLRLVFQCSAFKKLLAECMHVQMQDRSPKCYMPYCA